MDASSPLPRTCGRTVLRRLADADLARFQMYRADPEVARYQDWQQMTDREAMSFVHHANTAEFLLPGRWFQVGIAYRSNGILIGDIGICVSSDKKEAEIGFTLDRSYQKHGLGREAVRGAMGLIFERTQVDRIVGITDERNLASVKLLKALGMERIEALSTVFHGERCIELTFSVSRAQFQSE